jgi:anti-sigma factor ChrR (cupin superfamily)
MMLLNSDFSQRAIVTPMIIASPQPGVERLMLDRIGREQARATSLVRYAPGSEFPHTAIPAEKRFWCSTVFLPKTGRLSCRLVSQPGRFFSPALKSRRHNHFRQAAPDVCR